jgi:hypothetical protein
MAESLVLPIALGVLLLGIALWSIGGGAWLRVYGLLLAAASALVAAGASLALIVLAFDHWQEGGAWLLGFLPAGFTLTGVMTLLARTLWRRWRATPETAGD